MATVLSHAKKVISEVPSHALHTGGVLLVGKALAGTRKKAKLTGAIAAVIAAHFVREWAHKK